MPNQDQSDQNATASKPFPLQQPDLPPPRPDFMNAGSQTADSPPASQAVPTDGATLVPKPNFSNGKIGKKFGTGKIIATILGLVVLVGGIGTGIVLTQEKQLLEQKAVVCPDTCTVDNDCGAGYECKKTATGCPSCVASTATDYNRCEQGQTEIRDCTQTINGESCPGKAQYSCANGEFVQSGSCQDIADLCPRRIQNSCTGRVSITQSPSNNTTSNNISITQLMLNECRNACSSANLYASKCVCSDISSQGCNTGCTMVNPVNPGDTISLPDPTCGKIQIDIGCKDSNNTYGTVAFVSKEASAACGGTTTVVTSSPTSSPTAPSCISVSTYSSDWTVIEPAARPAIAKGTTINFCVKGNSPSGAFDKAQFMIGTVVQAETTTVRPGSTDFCQSYTILDTDTTISVKAKIHHPTDGWVGEIF